MKRVAAILAMGAVAVVAAGWARAEGAAPADEHAAGAAAHPDTKPLLNIGDAAPPFMLRLYNPDANTATFNLREFVGDGAEGATKGVFISFFASWCGPCKKELPMLVKLNEKYKSQGLAIVSISIDKDDAGFQKIHDLINDNKIVHAVAQDRFQLVARKYLGAETTLPAVFLVKRDGTIAFTKQKYDADVSTVLETEIRKVIGG